MNAEKTLTIQNDAASVLVRLRGALQAVVSHIPGDLKRPKDLQLKLGVEYKLCWQVLTITRTQEPLSISQYVPGMTSVNKFLAAVRSLGVPDDLIVAVEDAMREFGDVVKTHSDDRRGFDSMITAISGGEGAELIALQHRRDAFRSESQIWGSQVDVLLVQMIVRKAENGNGYDRAFVSAKYGLRCLRQGVMPIIHGYRDTRSGRVSADQVKPLDQDAAQAYGAPVIPRFCSQPIPKFKTFEHSDGFIHNVLATEEIGRTSAVNMVFGGVVRNLKMERDEENVPFLLCGASIIAPTELAVVELFVHRASYGELSPQVWVHPTASGSEIPEVLKMAQPLPIYQNVLSMGSADKLPPVREVPDYALQLNYVFETLAWNPGDFDLFRLRVPYPILHTRVRIACPVHEKKSRTSPSDR